MVRCYLYGAHSEVIREALRTWLGRDPRLTDLDAFITRGVADAEANSVCAFEELREQLRALS